MTELFFVIWISALAWIVTILALGVLRLYVPRQYNYEHGEFVKPYGYAVFAVLVGMVVAILTF